MKQILYALGVILGFSVVIARASYQEIKLEYKPRLEPVSYRINQQVTSRAHSQPDKCVEIFAVLREENVTVGRGKLLVSEESVSYFDDRGKIIDTAADRPGSVLTVKMRDTRGNMYPENRRDNQAPLSWPYLWEPRALPIFPADRIKVGETWIETVAVHTWLHAFDVVVTSKLESVEDHLGFKCAKVSYRFYGHWNARQQSDNRRRAIDLMQFNSEEVIGTGVLYFAYELGTVVEKEQAFKYILDEHTKHWAKEGRIAMRVDNYLECEVKLQMKVQE